MSQKQGSIVSAVALEASRRLRALAEPRPVGDKVKGAIGRAARAAGLSYWRAFDLWYGKARRIDASELQSIRAAEAARARGAQRELYDFARDFEALAERAARIDPDMAGPFADAMRDIAGKARHLAHGNRLTDIEDIQ